MHVKYVGPFDSVYVPAVDADVAHGDTVEVDDETGARLCEQSVNWRAVKAKPGTPAASKE